MASRTAQVIIQVDDKSLVELNAEIKTLENSVKNLKIGTQEWITQNNKLGVLKTRFRDATDEAKRLQGTIQKVTGSDQLRSIAKLGAGMVGAFQTASSALALVGVNSKSFEQVTQKAVLLMATMSGLNQLAETFSSTNLKGLKSIAAGFTGLVTTIKGFSTATKAALVSTGIGVLVAGLGMVIANWNKISSFFAGKQEKTGLQEATKVREEIIKSLEDENKAFEEQERIVKEINEYGAKGRGGLLEDASTADAIEKANFALRQRGKLLMEQRRLQDLDKKTNVNELLKKADEAKANLDVAKQRLAEIESSANKSDLKTVQAVVELRKKQFNEAILNYNKQVEINNVLFIQHQNIEKQLKLNEMANDKRDQYISDNKEIIKQQEENSKQLQRDLTILNSEVDTVNQIYQARKKLLEIEQKQLEDLPIRKTAEDDRIFAIITELKALKNQNDLYNNTVKKANEKYKQDLLDLEIQKKINIELADAELKYVQINEDNKKRGDELQHISDILNNEITSIEDQQKKFEELLAFDRKINDTRKITTEDIVQNLKSELGFYIAIQDATREKLENEKLILENQHKINDAKIQEKEDAIAILGEQYKINEAEIERAKKQLSGVGKDPYLSRAEKQQKILELQGEINKLELENKGIITSIAVANNEISDATNENLKASTQIAAVDIDINKTISDTTEKTIQTTEEIEKQVKLYKKLQNFLGNYAEEIDAILRGLLQSMELIATTFEANATRHQDEIDRLNVQYDEMNTKEQDRQDRILAYEEELKDANGDRYDELLRLIDQEKAAKDVNFVSEIDQKNKLATLEHKKLLDENKAAKWRKAQSIVEAIILGSIAFIKALPRLVLAIATGILVAAQVATIAAQKIPDVPPQEKFKKGGFTGIGDEDEVAGITHKGEYIVPAKILKSPSSQHHIAALEKQRIRGYAEGGLVLPSNISSPSGFEYDKLVSALSEAISKLPNPQVGLINISAGLRDVELTKQSAGISR